MMKTPCRSSRRTVPIVLLAVVSVLALAPVPAAAEPIRKQIKEAREDLLRFERDLARLVRSFDRLQEHSDAQSKRIRSLRKILHATDGADAGYEHGLARWLIGPLATEALEKAEASKEITDALLPQLRREIWLRGSEREEKIETLDAAIELLEAARSGELVTKAGVGGGDLITYSADWAAIAQCESSGRWHINTGLFDGGLQFLPSTWWGFGGGEYARYAYQATPRQQIDIAERVLAVQGPQAWPNCFKALPVDVDE